MFRIIPALLTKDQVKSLHDIAAKSEFVDGRISARTMPEEVKKNEQVKPSEDNVTAINQIIAEALRGNKDFLDFAMPQRFQPATVSRYQTGMYYERHLDAPIMGHVNKLRTDLSVTIFLSDIDTYDGGELAIEMETGEEMVKLPAGDAIVYETSAYHRVAEITRGERLAAVTWIQSLVRDPARRQILRNLSESLKQVREVAPDSEVAELLHETYANLMRMWAEI